jgi:4-amino-4-deoxy-L-arabinose transferase-like glycosyltransferase
MSSPRPFRGRSPRPVWAALALVAAALLWFAQTLAWYPDEGFHLLAAQMVGGGAMPYRDFFYQHPPLFAYLYAGWMGLFGATWRSAHALSALLTAAMIALVADYAVNRQAPSRTSAGIVAILLAGLTVPVVFLGTVGHPYALCMFLCVLAFRLAVRGRVTSDRRVLVLAGAAAGGAALSSLLVAPLIPVMAVWLAVFGPAARRFRNSGWFLLGLAIWLPPLAWLFAQAPRAFLFELFEYQLFYRGPTWRMPPASSFVEGGHVLARWAGSGEMLPRILLAAVGLVVVFFRRSPDDPPQADSVLAAAIVTALALFLCVPYPTFSFYFVVVVPFVAVLASRGAQCLIDALPLRRLPTIARRAAVAVALAAIFVRAVNGNLYLFRMPVWENVERIAVEINRVAPAGTPVYAAHPLIYFAARRVPIAGTESRFGSELELPAEFAASLGVVPTTTIDNWIGQARYGAVWMYQDDPRINSLALATIYRNREAAPLNSDGLLFWKAAR